MRRRDVRSCEFDPRTRRGSDHESVYLESAVIVSGRRRRSTLCVGALVKIDETTGRAVGITRVDEPGPTASAPSEPEPKIDIENAPAPEQT